jgi:peptide/nickel transport system substrate-binding protein
MDKASSTALEDPNAANQLWAGVDKATTDKAPWVSLVNTKMLDFTSARVKGFQFSPQWYFLLAQASVK